ncbi:lipopolysaccharide-binding protein-like [Clytia hemisphaerica]|uniref:Uncharacterized protein n=1 Tax=Clytia hemisphaerica TaxID=252671 RepID=A0A7M5X0A4_9CNID
MFSGSLLGVVLLVLASFSLCAEHGVQMRLTKKGMDYAVNVGIDILKKDLKNLKINKKGTYGKVHFNIKDLSFSELDFGQHALSPVEGVGMKGVVSGIGLTAYATFSYTYIFFSDTTQLRLIASGIDFDMTLKIGDDKGGHPTISVQECHANVGSIDVAFKGGMSFIYNLLKSKIESEMEETLKSLLCKMVTEEINTKASQELATFPVVRKIDSYAEIDYRLTEPPRFTKSYMDAYLKGEFKSSTDPEESQNPIPEMTTNDLDDNMVYFWVSDYTFNTAGEVYHKANKLQFTVNAWDKNTPAELKTILDTTKFIPLFPSIVKDYPNQPMGVEVSSFQAPHVVFTKKDANFHLYATTKFSVKEKELFTFQFDIKAGASFAVRETNITAKIDYFTYNGKVTQSVYGDPTLSLDNAFVKALVQVLVIKNANDALNQGFPLPKVKEVTFENFNVFLQKDSLGVGTDLKYVQ